jgi:TolA-binding protein
VKRLEAMIAAVIVTGIIGACILLVGASALLNPNSVPASNSADEPAAVANLTAGDPQTLAQVNQLKDIVGQYQNREKQYQSQIDQLNGQVKQLQGIMTELQRRGVIRILNDGTIQLGRSNLNSN